MTRPPGEGATTASIPAGGDEARSRPPALGFDRITRELAAVAREAVALSGNWSAVRGARRVGAERELRVAHLMLSFRTGGLERLVQSLCRAGAQMGVRSFVIAYGEDGELRATLPLEGTQTTFLPTPPGVSPALGVMIARHLRALDIDVLHSHHLGPFLYGALASRIAGIPHVHTEHSREMYDARRRRALGRLMRHLAVTVCVSNELAQWRRAQLGDDPEFVPNGVAVPPEPTPAARRASRAAIGLGDGFVVGCVARLAPEKDHETLLRAFRLLHADHPAATLVLAGSGPAEARIRALIDQLGLGSAVRVLGNRPDADALTIAFDVIALSSTREGLPLALLEGMASGAPVVATDVGEIRKLTDGGCGRHVAAGNPEALAAALAHYATDPAARVRDGMRAREKVQSEYSADVMTRRYVQIYRAAAGFGASAT